MHSSDAGGGVNQTYYLAAGCLFFKELSELLRLLGAQKTLEVKTVALVGCVSL